MESVWSVSKLLTESVGSRRQLVVIVFTPPTRQNSFVAAVCGDVTPPTLRRVSVGNATNDFTLFVTLIHPVFQAKVGLILPHVTASNASSDIHDRLTFEL